MDSYGQAIFVLFKWHQARSEFYERQSAVTQSLNGQESFFFFFLLVFKLLSNKRWEPCNRRRRRDGGGAGGNRLGMGAAGMDAVTPHSELREGCV